MCGLSSTVKKSAPRRVLGGVWFVKHEHSLSLSRKAVAAGGPSRRAHCGSKRRAAAPPRRADPRRASPMAPPDAADTDPTKTAALKCSLPQYLLEKMSWKWNVQVHWCSAAVSWGSITKRFFCSMFRSTTTRNTAVQCKNETVGDDRRERESTIGIS